MTQDPAKLEAVTVEQADREAAADYQAEGNPNCSVANLIRTGLYYDDSRLVQAFARHRLSHPSSATSARAEKAFQQIKHSIVQARIPGNDWKRELALIENTIDAALIGTTPAPSRTAIETITEMLRLDPACSGRVTVDTIERLAAMIQPTPASGGAGINSAVDSAHQILNLDQVEIQKAPGHVQSLAREIVAALSTTQQAEPAPLAGEVERVARAVLPILWKKECYNGITFERIDDCRIGGRYDMGGRVEKYEAQAEEIARAAIAALSPHKAPGDAVLTVPLLRPPYAEEHPILAPIIQKRAEVAAKFTPEFSLQRGADFDRGLMCAFEVVNATLQRMTAALSPDTAPAGEGEGA